MAGRRWTAGRQERSWAAAGGEELRGGGGSLQLQIPRYGIRVCPQCELQFFFFLGIVPATAIRELNELPGPSPSQPELVAGHISTLGPSSAA